MNVDRPTVYRLMEDRTLASAIADLEQQVAQLPYLREPPPPRTRVALEDALLAARHEQERRRC